MSEIQTTELNYFVLDDDPIFSSILQRTAHKIGCNITCAPSYKNAVKILKDNNSFNAIILDYDLQEMTGIEAAEKFSHLYPDIPLFLISSTDRPICEKTMNIPNYKGFITKWQGYRKIIGELLTKAR